MVKTQANLKGCNCGTEENRTASAIKVSIEVEHTEQKSQCSSARDLLHHVGIGIVARLKSRVPALAHTQKRDLSQPNTETTNRSAISCWRPYTFCCHLICTCRIQLMHSTTTLSAHHSSDRPDLTLWNGRARERRGR